MGTEHSLDDWLYALQAMDWTGRRVGKEWKGPCPRCGGDDRFHVAPGDRVLVVAHCRHDCTFQQLRETVFSSGETMTPRPSPTRKGRPVHASAGADNAQLDRSALNPGGLAKELLERLTLQTQAKRYLERRRLDPGRLEAYGWRSIIMPADWRGLADLPARYGWPPWENGCPRWPLRMDRDAAALVIPLRDHAGKLVGVRFRGDRRWREARQRRQLSAPKSINLAGVPPQLYGADALAGPRGGVLHIAEGEIDAESLREHGADALGVPGASIWRTEWTDWIRKLRPRRAVIWFDGDGAGDKGGRRLQEALADYHVYRLINVDNRDVNDLNGSDELEELIRRAEEL